MMLFVDGCMREHSRTRELAQAVLAHFGGEAETLVLAADGPAPLTPQTLALRDKLLQENELDHPMLRFAHQFAAADTVVVAAPYWDLLFPAAVRAYFEAVTVSGVTFRYDDHGVPRSLCRAKRLVYVTTAGGPIMGNFGFQYVQAMAQGFFGIGQVDCVSAEGLDIIGADVSAILEEAKKQIPLL